MTPPSIDAAALSGWCSNSEAISNPRFPNVKVQARHWALTEMLCVEALDKDIEASLAQGAHQRGTSRSAAEASTTAAAAALTNGGSPRKRK